MLRVCPRRPDRSSGLRDLASACRAKPCALVPALPRARSWAAALTRLPGSCTVQDGACFGDCAVAASPREPTAEATPPQAGPSPEREPTLSIVLPTYNEADTLREVLEELLPISRQLGAEIIVVDDGSDDATSEILAAIDGIRTVRHRTRKGYGAAIKAGVAVARADVIGIMDADGQHQPGDLARLASQLDDYDMVVGARSTTPRDGWRRRIGRAVLRRLANFLSPEPIPDPNSGLRVFRKRLFASFVHFLPDGFSLSTTLTLAAHCDRRDVRYVPITIRSRQGGRSTVNLISDGFAGLLLILRCVMLFNPLNVLLPVSGALLLVGVAYGLVGVILNMHIPAGAVFCLLSGVTLFAFGLLADQMATLIRRK